MYGSILIVSRCFDRGPLYFDRQVASQFNIVTFNVFFVVIVVVVFFFWLFSQLTWEAKPQMPIPWNGARTLQITSL